MNRYIIKTNGHKRHTTYSGSDDLRISKPRTTGTCVISTQTQNATTRSVYTIAYMCLFSIVHIDCCFACFPLSQAVLAYASKTRMESSYLQRLWTTQTYLLYFRKTPIRNAYALRWCLPDGLLPPVKCGGRKFIFVAFACTSMMRTQTERKMMYVGGGTTHSCLYVVVHTKPLYPIPCFMLLYVRCVALRMKREQTSGCSAFDRVWMRHVQRLANCSSGSSGNTPTRTCRDA